MKYYEVVTDGNVFRITARSYGGNPQFIIDFSTGKAREFRTKEDAEAAIHYDLSMSEWKKA